MHIYSVIIIIVVPDESDNAVDNLLVVHLDSKYQAKLQIYFYTNPASNGKSRGDERTCSDIGSIDLLRQNKTRTG